MIDLGASYGGLGDVVAAEGKSADALALYDRALQALQVAQASAPRRVRSAFYLIETYRSRALVLAQLGRHDEAIQDYDRAIEQTPQAKRAELCSLRTQSLLQGGLSQQLVWPLLWGWPRF
jgi:tetratricopeptide (TPR) repeat protein